MKSAIPDPIVTNFLSGKQKRIVSVAANTAVGNVEPLASELEAGLDNELNEAEIKDIIMQSYSHCGFALTLQSIVVFESVLEKRIADGNASKSKLSVIRDMDKFIRSQCSEDEQCGYVDSSSGICGSDYLRHHGYACGEGENSLSQQERVLVSIAVLTAMAVNENLLLSQINIGLNIGLDIGVLSDVMFIIHGMCPDRGRIASNLLFQVINGKTT
jgi:Uncharacterized homolog of gamma-carboxymuconolactone decarboxylase subunit